MKALRYILLPFALLYWIPVKIRNFLFDINLLKGYSPDIPTICIGNITVGGTGKTPHSEYLIEILQNKYQVGLLSRGYKRKTNGFKIVETTSTVNEVGDEPLQIKLKYPNAIVAVDEDRVTGSNELVFNYPDLKVLLLDDAFQHRYIKPGLSILLTNFDELISRDFFIPAGRLRDSLSEKRRANIIVVTKCPKDLSGQEMENIRNELVLKPTQNIYFTTVTYGDVKPIFSEYADLLTPSSSQKVFAVAGIANPKPFYGYLEKKFQIDGKNTYPDHHRFSEKEIRLIFERFCENTLLVTTEKDAARIRCLNLSNEIKQRLFYLSIKIEFLNNSAENFNKQILDYVGEN